jgi:mannose-6-phosphate isomerase-like protein (cupin superfamily)
MLSNSPVAGADTEGEPMSQSRQSDNPFFAGKDPWRVTVAEAEAVPLEQGRVSALLMRHGAMTVRHYAPKGEDRQVPHDQDEVYIVISGSGFFVNGDDRVPFASGDVLFAAAGDVHRFEDFSDDFATWVVFYGPEGGERPS